MSCLETEPNWDITPSSGGAKLPKWRMEMRPKAHCPITRAVPEVAEAYLNQASGLFARKALESKFRTPGQLNSIYGYAHSMYSCCRYFTPPIGSHQSHDMGKLNTFAIGLLGDRTIRPTLI